MTNPITEEIRNIRQQLAARFHNDLDLIVADLQRQQRESNREIIGHSQRVPKQDGEAIQSIKSN